MWFSKLNDRRGKPQVVHANPLTRVSFWYRFFEPQLNESFGDSGIKGTISGMANRGHSISHSRLRTMQQVLSGFPPSRTCWIAYIQRAFEAMWLFPLGDVAKDAEPPGGSSKGGGDP